MTSKGKQRCKMCKRRDCLYHASPKSYNACDYILCTGRRRDCPTGKLCNKYGKATSAEQSAIAERTWKHYDWNYSEDGTPYLEVFSRW